MTRRLISVALIVALCFSLIVSAPVVMAAERMEFTVPQATKQKTGGTIKMYGSTMLAYAGAGVIYDIDIPEDGTYEIIIRASTASQAKATASVNEDSAPEIAFNTESESVYQEILLNTVNLKKGSNTIDVTVTSGYILLTHVYINKTEEARVDFKKTEGTFRTFWLPTVIQAENFDLGSAKSMTNSRSLKQAYRSDSVLAISEETEGTIVKMSKGDSMEYTFNVQDGGVFNLSAYAITAGDIRLYFDDNPGYVEASLETVKDVEIGNIYFGSGVHKVRVECVSDSANIDRFRFKTATDSKEHINPSELTEGTCIVIGSEENKQTNPVWKELWVSPEGSARADGSEKNPFGSISAAKEAAAKLSANMQGDIIVNILPGTYPITETLQFTTKDSGKNGFNIVYRGTDPENKPILSGGRKISGWEKLDDKIWTVKVDEDIDMVRQLYINEYPARIARSKYLYGGGRAYNDPSTSFAQDGFYISKKNFPTLTNTDDVELLYLYNWVLHYLPLSGIEDAGEEWLVKFDQPYYGNLITALGTDAVSPVVGTDLFISNAPELIDEPGEFWFDKDEKKIYYYAYPEEDMTTAEVYTPKTRGLINIEGVDKTNRVENLSFDNLDFRLGSWNDVATIGLGSEQGDILFSSEAEKATRIDMHAQIEANFADGLSFTNCNFINLGSTCLALRKRVTNSVVEGNIFRDSAGSAVVVSDTKYGNANTIDDLSRFVTVKNNVIRRIGHDYMNSLGVMVLYANSIDVMHNDIRYVPYSGISVGWGWGAAVSRTMRCGDHRIANNRIALNSYACRDGASIYTLGSMVGTFIEGNYLSDSPDLGGIYFDSGSESIVARDNVFENNKTRVINAGSLIWDIYRNYANYVDRGSSAPWRSGTAEKQAMITERPIRTEGDNWSDEAKAIMADAGLQDEYKHLLSEDKIAYPEWRTMSMELMSKNRYTSDTAIIKYAADYIPGGEGVGFHELNGTKPEDYGGTTFVGNTKTGEWMKYNLNIKKDGNYDINMRYALQSAPACNATLYLDGVKICDAKVLEPTGTWDAYVRALIANVYLTEGDHELMLEFTGGAFAVLNFEANYTDAGGNDISYDDGIMFTLPQ